MHRDVDCMRPVRAEGFDLGAGEAGVRSVESDAAGGADRDTGIARAGSDSVPAAESGLHYDARSDRSVQHESLSSFSKYAAFSVRKLSARAESQAGTAAGERAEGD